ncbi:hypothetical protein Pmani_026924 [Petrolisthes manimaculis]|uniref:Uncharacterized protein n=1 Tax=Petrolisthes manimaculis TaxID=1843537 RepID=A0AAE1P3R2_9EUCA|nr:hypothetical protein Pmani_026924 [Petrolisthes manimaculis]
MGICGEEGWGYVERKDGDMWRGRMGICGEEGWGICGEEEWGYVERKDGDMWRGRMGICGGKERGLGEMRRGGGYVHGEGGEKDRGGREECG